MSVRSSNMNTGGGLPREVMRWDLFNQGADIAVLTLQFTTLVTGCYLLLPYSVITTADAVSSTFPQNKVQIKDGDTGVTNSFTLTNTSAANAVGFPSTALQNSQGGIINCQANSIISPFTNGYVSNTPGQMKFALHVRLLFFG